MKKEKKREPLPLLHAGVGSMVSSMTISGFILGFGADYLAGTTPIFMMIFGALGLVGGIMKAHRVMSITPGNVSSEKSDKRSSKEL